MEKKWVYTIGRFCLVLGILLFTGSILSHFIRGFLAGFNGVPVETYKNIYLNLEVEGFMLLATGILLVGFYQVIIKISKKG